MVIDFQCLFHYHSMTFSLSQLAIHMLKTECIFHCNILTSFHGVFITYWEISLFIASRKIHDANFHIQLDLFCIIHCLFIYLSLHLDSVVWEYRHTVFRFTRKVLIGSIWVFCVRVGLWITCSSADIQRTHWARSLGCPKILGKQSFIATRHCFTKMFLSMLQPFPLLAIVLTI